MNQLPLEILMAEGHLTDIGASTLADGEEALVPAEVLEHARACASCGALVRNEALASVQLGDVVRAAMAGGDEATVAGTAPRAAHAMQRAPDGAPWIPVFAGIALAAVGAVMTALGGSFAPLDRLRDARTFGVVVARGLRAAFHADLPPPVTFSSTALLLLLALFVMRASPQSRKVIPS